MPGRGLHGASQSPGYPRVNNENRPRRVVGSLPRSSAATKPIDASSGWVHQAYFFQTVVAGTPMTVELGGTSLITSELAAIVALSPIFTLPTILAPA